VAATSRRCSRSCPRSFKRDVIPILAQSCASQMCHGDPQNDLRLRLVVSDPDAVYAELQRDSVAAKGAKLVVPGDPAKSFLYAKIVGDQDAYTDMCTMPGCGETMPPGSKIPSVQRDTIQQWIAEGATNE
jgi:hypothetical protein